MHVLLVEDDVQHLEILSQYLTEHGHVVTVAEDGEEGLKHILHADEVFDVVVTDIGMPVMSGLQLLEKLRDNSNDVPFILMTDEYSVQYSMKAISLGAFEYILKPFEAKVLVSKLEKLASLTITVQEWSDTLAGYHEDIHVSIPSHIKYIRGVMNRFHSAFKTVFILHKIDSYKVGLSLEEALANAIIHGNLEVPSSLKEENWELFEELIRERQMLPAYEEKLVNISYKLDQVQLEIRVEDMGNGFDVKKIPKFNDPMQMLSSGRGILIMRQCMDQVFWNDSGNCVTMTKQLDPELKSRFASIARNHTPFEEAPSPHGYMEKLHYVESIARQIAKGHRDFLIYNNREDEYSGLIRDLASIRDQFIQSRDELSLANQRLNLLLKSTQGITTSYDKLKLLANTVDTLLLQIPLTNSVFVHFAFREVEHAGTSGYAYFKIPVFRSPNGTLSLKMDTIKDIEHSFSWTLPTQFEPFAELVHEQDCCSLFIGNLLSLVAWKDALPAAIIQINGIDSHRITKADHEFGEILAQFLMISLLDLNRTLELELKVIERTTDLEDALKQVETMNEQFQEDLNIAVETQEALLGHIPPVPYVIPGIYFQPWGGVSGDMYDAHLNRERDFNFFLGDATGHGTSAAFLTVMAKMGLQMIPPYLPSDEIMGRLNQKLNQCVPSDKFLSAIYLRITEKGELRITNAAHPPLMLISQKDARMELVKKSGLPLGMFGGEEAIPYTEKFFQLNDGDKLLMYTDGVTESTNHDLEPYGIPRLETSAKRHCHLMPDAFVQAIMDDLNVFIDSKPIDDDLTIICLQFKAV